MSKIQNLLDTLCPNGVEFRALGELGEFYNGLNGKKKNDFVNGNARYISYLNIFENLSVKLNKNDFVTIKSDEKQNNIKKGDILFTTSSETPNDCGMSSVVTQEPKENIYLNSFCFGFRLKDKNLFLPDFLKYLFRQVDIRKQIIKTADGVTRFNISKSKFSKIKIPLPPLEVQREIVKILDTFTELKTELEARKKQYRYYLNALLDFGTPEAPRDNVEFKNISTFANCVAGATPSTSKKEYWEKGTIPWMSSGEVNFRHIDKTYKKITTQGYKNSSTKMLPKNTVVVALAGQGKTRGLVAITQIELCTNQSLCGIVLKENERVNSKFLYYYLSKCYQHLRSISNSDGSRGGLTLTMLKSYPIPLPPLKVQNEIVEILEKFETLTHSLSDGIPREIELREKQYCYYRDALLSFKQKES